MVSACLCRSALRDLATRPSILYELTPCSARGLVRLDVDLEARVVVVLILHVAVLVAVRTTGEAIVGPGHP